MLILLHILIKINYWIFIGWWLKPIRCFKQRKIQKMQNEITKHEYEKIKQEKKEEI